jgi:CDP-diacylglycerol---glycerol-3-phosphate 3-phosphatidyltransferase
MFNLPNCLTMMRIGLIPCFAICYYAPYADAKWWATCIFASAALTDWLDGYFARKLNQTSAFGAFLDPVADKLMVAIVLIVLLQDDPRILLAIPVAVIIGREITVSALREWMAELGARRAVAVSIIGKWKTGMQMCSIGLLIIGSMPMAPSPCTSLGVFLLYCAAVLTLWSMFLYLKAAWGLVQD